MIQSTIGMFQIFAGFGLGLTATKFVAEFRFKDVTKAGRVISLSIYFAAGSGALVAIILFIFAPWVAERILAAPVMGGLLRIGSPMLLFGAIAGAQTGTLAGFEAFRTIAKVNIISGLLNFPCLIVGVYIWGVVGAVWALVVSSLFGVCLNQFALYKECKCAGIIFPAQNAMVEQDVLWRFSLPSVLASMLVTPVNWVSSAMLVNQPGGYSEMGIFNAANQWRGAILFLPGVLCQVGLPLLCSLNNDSAKKTSRKKVLLYNLILNGGTTLIAALFVSVLSLIIMKTYGESFVSGYTVLIFLAISTVFLSINNVIGQLIASKGKMWHGLCFNAIWAFALLLMSYYLIPIFGAQGLACSYLVAYMVHTLVQSMYALKNND